MAHHYTKSGALDMRYSSSRSAISAGASGASSGYSSGATAGTYGGYSGGRSSGSSYVPSTGGLTYKKDGSLDMRYTSSQRAVAGGMPHNNNQNFNTESSALHFKKDGSLDMRYATSQQAKSSGSAIAQSNSSENHYKKDGTMDMRYQSSRQTDGIEQAMKGLTVNKLHYKKDGTLDLRYKSSKEAAGKDLVAFQSNARDNYWHKRMADDEFVQQWAKLQHEKIYMPLQSDFNRDEVQKIRNEFNQISKAQMHSDLISRSKIVLSTDIKKLDYSGLSFTATVLGKGAFGVVKKAKLNSVIVAVKQLHMDKLTRTEMAMFEREVTILSYLGKHENLVQFYGYCLNPPCIVMEFVDLGSLSYLLHYCEDAKIEVKMADGRIKKRIIVGIVDGMRQLHDVEVVHGDIKPQNILVTNDFTAKITDFGLSNLRGKTSCTMVTDKVDDEIDFIGGTGGYMAPELLNSSSPPDYTSDLYSFGILMNEVVAEEEPYSEQQKNFAGRGPFAAVNYARLGNRPKIRMDTPRRLTDLINACWNVEPTMRPKFDKIRTIIRDGNFVIPSSPNMSY